MRGPADAKRARARCTGASTRRGATSDHPNSAARRVHARAAVDTTVAIRGRAARRRAFGHGTCAPPDRRVDKTSG